MLEPPAIANESIVACLRDSFAIDADTVTFLPLGADLGTAVYRARATDGAPYFVKLRRGVFDATSVLLPRFLYEHGVRQIIAPRTTSAGQLWADLAEFRVMVYPFISGRDASVVPLSEHQWREFGAALRQVHDLHLPPELARHIQSETYSPHGRASVRQFMATLDDYQVDSVALRLAAFLKEKQQDVLALVERAERLARMLLTNPPRFVVCHTDIHAWNVLVCDDGSFYMVDWDNPLFAPKERDLMFVGGALGFAGRTPQEEETLFYQGYGATSFNNAALAYYRTERVVQDIMAYCEQLFFTADGGADREPALHNVMWNFLPGATIERAYAVMA